MEPDFLELEQILALHEKSLAQWGGISGVRDQSGLKSAIGQPMNDFYYGNADLFGVAAAYAFHIAQAQAFLDGNKRTAVGAAMTFLAINGHYRTPALEPLYDAMIAIAEKRLTKAGLAEKFRELFG